MPPRDAAVPSLPAIEVTFSAPVPGVDADDLTVNGIPASSVEVRAANRYSFALASPPVHGPGEGRAGARRDRPRVEPVACVRR
jgi:hypothetical protein